MSNSPNNIYELFSTLHEIPTRQGRDENNNAITFPYYDMKLLATDQLVMEQTRPNVLAISKVFANLFN